MLEATGCKRHGRNPGLRGGNAGLPGPSNHESKAARSPSIVKQIIGHDVCERPLRLLLANPVCQLDHGKTQLQLVFLGRLEFPAQFAQSIKAGKLVGTAAHGGGVYTTKVPLWVCSAALLGEAVARLSCDAYRTSP